MRYWAYVNNEILGPYEKEEIKNLPAYAPNLLICPQTPVGEKTEEWREISTYPEFAEGTVNISPIISEQIPDQIETKTLQIDRDFNMTNSGRMISSRITPKPVQSAPNVDIPVNHLERSNRFKINPSSLEPSEQTTPEQAPAGNEAQSEISSDINLEIFPEQNQTPANEGQQNISLQPENQVQPEIQEKNEPADAFGSIFNSTVQTETPQENNPFQSAKIVSEPLPTIEPNLEPIQGLTEATPKQEDNSLNAPPLTMENTQEFAIGIDPEKTPAPSGETLVLNTSEQQLEIQPGFEQVVTPNNDTAAKQQETSELPQTFDTNEVNPNQANEEQSTHESVEQTIPENIEQITQDAVEEAPEQAGVNEVSQEYDVNTSKNISGISEKIDLIAQNAITREDFTMAVDPIKMKLDQLDDMLSSMKDSQFQQDILNKLEQLESAISDMKLSVGNASSTGNTQVPPMPSSSPAITASFSTNTLAPADPNVSIRAFSSEPTTSTASLTSSDTQQNEQTQERAKAAESKDKAPAAAKPSALAGMSKAIIKIVIAVIILSAVIFGTTVALKKFNVFDVSPMLKTFLPQGTVIPLLINAEDWQDNANAEGISNVPSETTPASDTNTASETPVSTTTATAALTGEGAVPAEQTNPAADNTANSNVPVQNGDANAAVNDKTENVRMFIHGYKVSETGPSVADKLSEAASAVQATYSAGDWNIAKAEGTDNLFTALLTINAKPANLVYSFDIDYDDVKQDLKASNPAAKALIDSLTPKQEAVKPAPAKSAKKRTAKRGKKSRSQAAANTQENYSAEAQDPTAAATPKKKAAKRPIKKGAANSASATEAAKKMTINTDNPPKDSIYDYVYEEE